MSSPTQLINESRHWFLLMQAKRDNIEINYHTLRDEFDPAYSKSLSEHPELVIVSSALMR